MSGTSSRAWYRRCRRAQLHHRPAAARAIRDRLDDEIPRRIGAPSDVHGQPRRRSTSGRRANDNLKRTAPEPPSSSQACRDASATERLRATFSGADYRRRGDPRARVAAVCARQDGRLHAGRGVGEEYVRATVAFLTNDLAALRARRPAVITVADAEYGSQALDHGRSEPTAAAMAVIHATWRSE